MSEHSEPPLLVEVLLIGGRIKGLCRGLAERRRLMEVLNSPEAAFSLEDAAVKLQIGPPRRTHALAIEKKSIVAAIPWETPEQARQRVLSAATVGRSPTSQVPVVAFAPPYVIEGTAHLSPGAAAQKGALYASSPLFSRFFSVTNARLTLPDGSDLKAPVVLVNRETVSALERVEQAVKGPRDPLVGAWG